MRGFTRASLPSFAGGALLAVFALAQMQHLGFVFDHSLSLTGVGAAIAGIALARATSPPGRGAGAGAGTWLAAGALAMAAARASLELLPAGSGPAFVVVVVAHGIPFFCGGRALATAQRADPSSPEPTSGAGAAAVAGAVVGILGSAAALDLAGGAPRSSGIVAAAFALLGVAGGGGRRAFRVAALVVVVVASASSWSRESSSTPRWMRDARAALKPVLAELGPGGAASVDTTIWNARGRTDLVTFRGQEGQLRWLFTNGTTPVPLPEGVETRPEDWWDVRFPLLALPYRLADPARVLTVGSAPGAEVEAGRRLTTATIVAEVWDRNAVALRADAPADVRIVEAWRDLRGEIEAYDLVFLASSHTARSAWLHSNPGDDRRYTREAFAHHWARVRSGGWLAIATSDERLFVRAALLAAELGDDPGVPLGRRAWGLGLAPAARASPYRHLLLLRKGATDSGGRARLVRLARSAPVEPWFGPGFEARPPYDALAQLDAAVAREALRRAFGRRAGRPLDLGAATDDRPFFFHIAQEAHPLTKWLVGACGLGLVAVLMLPLSRERRLDHAAAAARPPVPVVLGTFALLATALAFALTGLGHAVPFVTGVPVTKEPFALAGMALGFGAAWFFGRRRPDRGGHAEVVVAAGAAIALALVAGAVAPAFQSAGSLPARALAAVGLGLVAGAAASAPLALASTRLARTWPAALPWAWAAHGLSGLVAVAVAPWIARDRGWDAVWLLAASACVVVAGIALWIRAVGRDPHTLTASG